MTINYTTLLGMAKPVTGTESGTWGDVVNDQITSLVEDAIANAASLNVTSGNITLTDNNGSSDQARMAILLVTGTPGVSRNIVAPSTSKWYIVKNGSNAEVVLKGSATTGVTIPAGVEALAFWNGSDFELVSMVGPSSSTDNAITRYDGTTGKVVQNSGVTIDDSNNMTGVVALTATGVVTVPAGTNSAPAITTTGDTNTGIYFPAADTIAFTEGGTESVRIDSSGNVGIGTTLPGAKLQVVGIVASTGSGTSIFAAGEVGTYTLTGITSPNYGIAYGVLTGQTNPALTVSGFDAIAFGTNQAERMRLNSSGNLGIGTASPGYSATNRKVLALNGGSGAGEGAILAFMQGGTNKGYLFSAQNTIELWSESGEVVIGNNAAAAVKLLTNNTERMRIDGSGNLGIGTSSPGAKLDVVGSGVFKVDGSGSTTPLILRNNNTVSTQLVKLGFDSNGAIKASINAAVYGDDYMTFNVGSDTERARITSGGYFKASNNGTYAGSTSSYHEFYSSTNSNFAAYITQAAATSPSGLVIQYTAAAPNGAGNHFVYCQDNVALRATILSNGGLSNYQANNVNLSDRREKTNFAPAKSYLDTICAIPVQTFNYIDQAEDDPGLTLGVIAQDVQAVAPELVTESNWGTQDDPKMRLSIYQTDLQYALMKCIQELKTELDSVKAELAALKGA